VLTIIGVLVSIAMMTYGNVCKITFNCVIFFLHWIFVFNLNKEIKTFSFVYRSRLLFEEDDRKTDFGNVFREARLIKRNCEVTESIVKQKRRRTTSYSSFCDDAITTSPSVNDVITAVERLSTNADLVADGSRVNSLPTVCDVNHDDVHVV